MVARTGIEPATRGFSVAGTVAADGRKSKTRQRFLVCPGALPTRPNLFRAPETSSGTEWPASHADQRLSVLTPNFYRTGALAAANSYGLTAFVRMMKRYDEERRQLRLPRR